MKQNKTALFFVFVLCTFTSLNAQLIDNVFVKKIPDILFPAMEKNLRFELVEYYKAGQKDTIKNVFQNDVFILDYDSINHYLSIKTTENSQFELKLFPTKEKIDSTSYIIGVINTVCAPACSSYIRFYNHKWNKIEVEFTPPTALDWLNKKEEETYGVKIAEILKTSLIEFHFDKNKNEIILKNNSAELLSVEDKLLIKPYLVNDDKTYKIKVANSKVSINP